VRIAEQGRVTLCKLLMDTASGFARSVLGSGALGALAPAKIVVGIGIQHWALPPPLRVHLTR